MHWQTARFRLKIARPLVMGIVNLTPDSFSADGHRGDVAGAVAHCERLLQEGADILDLGAESTRPGAAPVDAAEELDRLMPVLEQAVRLGVPISVDTSRPEVIAAALAAGAGIVNDVRALQLPGAWAAWTASTLNEQGVPVTFRGDRSQMINNVTNAIDVDSGLGHLCALQLDGTVNCWGSNYYGQLGRNSQACSPDPQPVLNVSAAWQLAVGKYHACAMITPSTPGTNDIQCWGLNNDGQLGDGTNVNSAVPVFVK